MNEVTIKSDCFEIVPRQTVSITAAHTTFYPVERGAISAFSILINLIPFSRNFFQKYCSGEIAAITVNFEAEVNNNGFARLYNPLSRPVMRHRGITTRSHYRLKA